MAIAGESSSVQKTSTAETVPAKVPQQQPAAWEDMEYGGLDLPTGLVLKNTFIECPNVRSASLDEFVEPRGWKSCPNSGIEQSPEKPTLSEIQSRTILEGSVESSASTTTGDEEGLDTSASTTAGPSENDSSREAGELPEGMLVKNTFIDYPTVRSTSLDEYYEDKGWKSCPVSRMQSEVENQVSEIQKLVIAEAASEDAGDEKEEEAPAPTLRLLDLLPRPEPVFSVGSIPHQLGQVCKPCGFVHKPEGCTNAANCQYCHLCPPGTIKQRKKVKKVMVRQSWQMQQQMQQHQQQMQQKMGELQQIQQQMQQMQQMQPGWH